MDHWWSYWRLDDVNLAIEDTVEDEEDKEDEEYEENEEEEEDEQNEVGPGWSAMVNVQRCEEKWGVEDQCLNFWSF